MKAKYPYLLSMTISSITTVAAHMSLVWTAPEQKTYAFLTPAARADWVKRMLSHCDVKISNLQYSTSDEA